MQDDKIRGNKLGEGYMETLILFLQLFYKFKVTPK